jgi:AbrB family looped-hinge helix DNA binding protein
MYRRVRVSEGGRIVIPAEYRNALNMEVGDDVILCLADGEIRLFTPDEAIRRAQEMVRRYVPEGRSLSDELIAERRAEAARE